MLFLEYVRCVVFDDLFKYYIEFDEFVFLNENYIINEDFIENK